jgi:SAM-dependent methyltransferase
MNTDARAEAGGEPVVAVDGDDYGDYYYSTYSCAPYDPDAPVWRNMFAAVADNIVRTLEPKTVLDAGCAKGMLVGALREREVDAEGIDLSEFAIAKADSRAVGHVRVGSLTEPFGKRYDLISCIEVLEHMTQPEALAAVANICASTDQVLISSTPDDFDEATHINVQPPASWSVMFADQGFYRRFDVDASFLSKVAVVYERREATIRRLVHDYETVLWTLRHENFGTRAAVLTRDRRCAQLDAQLKAALEAVEPTRLELEASKARERALQARVKSLLSSKRYRLGSAMASPLSALRKPHRDG